MSCHPDGSVCVGSDHLSGERGFEFWVEAHLCSVTITLSQTGENLRGLASGTFQVRKGERKKLFVASRVQPDQPWKHRYEFFSQCGDSRAQPDAQAIYALPFELGRDVRVSQGFHGGASHRDLANAYAVDFDVAENTPVHAARAGTVVKVEDRYGIGGWEEPEAHANIIRVLHADQTVAEYAHLRQRGVVVKVGQEVREGELIGFSGNSGRSSGPHLHFAVHLPIDGKTRRSVPIRFLGSDNLPFTPVEGGIYRRP